MNTEAIMLIGALLALAVFYILIPLALHMYGRYKDRRALRCPETGKLTSVQIEAGRAAGTSLFGKTKLRIQDCARWPERRDCGQECLFKPPFPSSGPI
jgi:hypothetical protein